MTMSEYILEQSISTATCSDIELERSLAEMNVLAEMCRCYEKAEMFSEYASDSSVVAECGIFLEADEATENSEEKKKKTFKEYGDSIRKVFTNLLNKFLTVIERLFGDQTTKALEKIPDGTIIVPKDSPIFDNCVIALSSLEMTDIVMNSFIESIETNDIKNIKIIADKTQFNEFIQVYRENLYGDSEYGNISKAYGEKILFTKEFMMENLKHIKQNKKFKKAKNIIDEINKKMISNDDNIKFYNENINDIKSAVNNISKFISENIKYVSYVYDECVKASAKKQKIYDKAIYGKMGAPRNKDGE